MNNKEKIIKTVIEMIDENGDGIERVTIREVAKRCGVSVGLINYHFSSKDELIQIAVDRIINGIVFEFEKVRDKVTNMTPLEKLEYLGNMTFDYLFDHMEISKISVISDLTKRGANDNTRHTYMAYLQIISEIKKGASTKEIKRLTFMLVMLMQQAFMRCDIIYETEGIDLRIKEERHKYHRDMIRRILGV